MVIVPIVIQFSCGQILIENALHALHSNIYICFPTIADENHPPKAHAGGDKIITLPVSLITLDGRESTDDRGIVSYSWTRDDKSLAAGVCYVIHIYIFTIFESRLSVCHLTKMCHYPKNQTRK